MVAFETVCSLPCLTNPRLLLVQTRDRGSPLLPSSSHGRRTDLNSRSPPHSARAFPTTTKPRASQSPIPTDFDRQRALLPEITASKRSLSLHHSVKQEVSIQIVRQTNSSFPCVCLQSLSTSTKLDHQVERWRPRQRHRKSLRQAPSTRSPPLMLRRCRTLHL